MAAMSESTARLVLRYYTEGRRYPLTMWEEAQLAWTWLQHHGHEVPEAIQSPSSAGGDHD